MNTNYRIVTSREVRGGKDALIVRIYRGGAPVGFGTSYRDSLATAVRKAVRDARFTRRFVPSITAR